MHLIYSSIRIEFLCGSPFHEGRIAPCTPSLPLMRSYHSRFFRVIRRKGEKTRQKKKKKSIFRVVQPFFEHSLARVCFSLGSKGILNLSDLKLYTLVRPRACAFCLGFFTCILEAHSSSRTVFCLLRCFSELVMLLYPAWQGSGSKLSRHGHNWVSTYTNLLPPSFS